MSETSDERGPVAYVQCLPAHEAVYWWARAQRMGLTDKEVGDLLRVAAPYLRQAWEIECAIDLTRSLRAWEIECAIERTIERTTKIETKRPNWPAWRKQRLLRYLLEREARRV